MELKIIKVVDQLLKHNINKDEAVARLLNICNVMPSLLSFKDRRAKLNKSIREISKETGVSPATISRIERGFKCYFGNVKALDSYYSRSGS